MDCLKCKRTLAEPSKYGLHEICFTNWFKTDPHNDFESLTQRSAHNQNSDDYVALNNTSFYHGKFKKYSAKLGTEDYIFKMRELKEAAELPEVEFVCNQIASLQSANAIVLKL